MLRRVLPVLIALTMLLSGLPVMAVETDALTELPAVDAVSEEPAPALETEMYSASSSEAPVAETEPSAPASDEDDLDVGLLTDNVTINPQLGRFEGLRLGVAYTIRHTATNDTGAATVNVPATHDGTHQFPLGTAYAYGRKVYIKANDVGVEKLICGEGSADYLYIFNTPTLDFTLEATGNANEFKFMFGASAPTTGRYYEYSEDSGATWKPILWNGTQRLVSTISKSDATTIPSAVTSVRVRFAGARDTVSSPTRWLFPFTGSTQTVTVPNPDQPAVDTATTAVQGMALTPVAQASYNDAAAIKTYILGLVNTAKNNDTVTATINQTGFAAAVAGTSEKPKGTDGSYTFTVTLSKGTASKTTSSRTLTIVATEMSEDTAAVANAVKAVESMIFSDVKQSAYNTSEALDAYLGDLISTAVTSDFELSSVVINNVSFIPAVAGDEGTPAGTPGSYTFTVTLGRGSAQQTTGNLVIAIDPTHMSGVEGVVLNHTSIYLNINKTATLTATVLPVTASNKNVRWETSNSDVATVDEDGVVTAVGAGTATIKVYSIAADFEAECAVEVSDKSYAYTSYDLPSGLSMDPETGAITGRAPMVPGTYRFAVSSKEDFGLKRSSLEELVLVVSE